MYDTERLIVTDALDTLRRACAGWLWRRTDRTLDELNRVLLSLLEVAPELSEDLAEVLEPVLDDLERLVLAADRPLSVQRLWGLWRSGDEMVRALRGLTQLDQQLQAKPRDLIPPLGPATERRGRVRVARQSSARVTSAG